MISRIFLHNSRMRRKGIHTQLIAKYFNNKLWFSEADRHLTEGYLASPFHKKTRQQKFNMRRQSARTQCLSERFRRGWIAVCRRHRASANTTASCGQERECWRSQSSGGMKEGCITLPDGIKFITQIVTVRNSLSLPFPLSLSFPLSLERWQPAFFLCFFLRRDFEP